ncbi:MAG: methylated-DNA--[protein]-cysteine S-methyltransferase [Clostridiales bacterium]|nr:methylated-DNA--[protein]-cysteine S-methyltransferase [Clostridiales bacterium]
MQNIWYYDFSIGTLAVAEDGAGITNIHQKRETRTDSFCETETPLLKEAARQLGEYFSGARTAFSLPLSLSGTDFQLSAWEALRAIPYGETRSYKQIAEQIGRPNACRAVGMANHRNPVMILVPCHRVIGTDGGLTGYAGGLDVKRYLLDLEKENRA